jgi:hypothetical protein
LIKPTRYDEEGYPVQWFRSLLPSLACVAALVEDAKARDILGADVDFRLTAADESNAAVFPKRSPLGADCETCALSCWSVCRRTNFRGRSISRGPCVPPASRLHRWIPCLGLRRHAWPRG